MVKITSKKIEVFSDLFTDLAAGCFGTLLIFPGVIGIKTLLDLILLLIINLPFGILCLLIALKLKEKI